MATSYSRHRRSDRTAGPAAPAITAPQVESGPLRCGRPPVAALARRVPGNPSRGELAHFGQWPPVPPGANAANLTDVLSNTANCGRPTGKAC